MLRIKQATQNTVRQTSNPHRASQYQAQSTTPPPSKERLIAQALVSGKTLHDVMKNEVSDNPHLCEALEMEMCALLSAEKNHPLITALKAEFNYVTLAQAKAFVKAYETQQKEGDEVPNAIKGALFVISKAQLFSTDKEAEDFFIHRQIIANEKSCCIYLKAKLEEDLGTCKEGFKPVVNLRIKGLTEQIANCQSKLDVLERKINPANLSIRAKQKLLDHLASSNVLLREMAISAQKDIEAYKEKIMSGLKRNGADLSRADLLEYLVGPKEFLFDYYGVVYHPESNDNSYPFLINHQRAGYRLGNSGPYALENEIRRDVEMTLNISSKERLVQENIRTKPVLPEVEELNKEIKPFLEKFAASSTETRLGNPMHSQVCKMLFDYNKWADFGVVPENVSLTKVDVSKEPYEVKGRVIVGSDNNEKVLYFTFSTDDLIMLIASRYTTTPDRVSTTEILRQNAPQK